jgi:two-component system OmpR family sensor kinase
MSVTRTFSLRARLLWLLLAAIAATATVQAVFAFSTANVQANGVFDYHMQQMAMSLRSGLAASAPAPGSDETAGEQGNAFVVQVWTSDGLLAYQSAHATQLPERNELGFSEVNANGIVYRVFSLRSRSQVIQVAQDLNARKAMARTLALRAVLPTIVMAPLLMLIVWAAVSLSLRPVSRVRQQVALRQPDELDEISEEGLPDEVRPLVSELNLLFGRVRQTFDAQNRFVADAAHELRSPLAALRLQIQGLEDSIDPGARETSVARLRAGVERATRLIEQLLTMARQQAQAARNDPPTTVSLLDIVRQAMVDAAPLASARRIDLGMRQADDALVAGRPDALRILVGNLLDNAVKYTPEGGTVDVDVRRVDGRVELVVDDSGPGIAEEERERVLDRFYRVPGGQTSGSGLGLAIAKSIADTHGAELTLGKSQRLGGLRVEVHFSTAGWPAG